MSWFCPGFCRNAPHEVDTGSCLCKKGIGLFSETTDTSWLLLVEMQLFTPGPPWRCLGRASSRWVR